MDDPSHDSTLPTDAARTYRTEPQLRAAIAATLRAHGVSIEEAVTCAAGTADIAALHRTAIIEVKWQLTRVALYQAIGQVLLYRSHLNPDARAIIVGYETRETLTLVPHIAALGVEVICWRDPVAGAQGSELTEALTHPVARPSALHPAALLWNVQTLAIARGFLSVRELSFATRKPRQSLYGIWTGQAKTVSLEMLTALAKGLDVDAGGWFAWEGSGEGRQLVWDVERQRHVHGMSVEELSFAARILPASLTPILDGVAQFVFVTTLAKLARALELDIGDLFVWGTADLRATEQGDLSM